MKMKEFRRDTHHYERWKSRKKQITYIYLKLFTSWLQIDNTYLEKNKIKNMGVASSGILNLPDSNYEYYIFILGGNANWKGGILESIYDNFDHIAKEIGKRSVVLKGLNPREWTEEISDAYFDGIENIETLIPAILVTDANPKQVKENSLRILISLHEIEKKFKSIEIFLDLLTDFTNNRNDHFVEFAKDSIDWIDGFNKVVELKPNFNGIGLNFNALLEIAFRKKKE